MTIAFLGIDLAKNVFQLHGANSDGQAVLKHRIRREGLLAEIADRTREPNARPAVGQRWFGKSEQPG